MLKSFCSLIVSITLLTFALPLCAETKAEPHQKEIAVKKAEIKGIEKEIAALSEEQNALSIRHDQVRIEHAGNQRSYDEAKDAYTRASQNIDIISAEQLTMHLKEYKAADKKLNASEKELQKTKASLSLVESKINRLNEDKLQREIDILEMKARTYESQLSEGVWAEGYGECILDENKTMKDCQQLSLDYAKRDAIEKGGKSLVESVTEVEMFELSRDEIKKTSKVNIIDQDNSGEFGKARRIISGDVIKFVARVRIKVQSVATYNPYREKIRALNKRPAETPQFSAPPPPAIDRDEERRAEQERLRRERLEKERYEALQKKVDALERERRRPRREEHDIAPPPPPQKKPARQRSYTPLPGF